MSNSIQSIQDTENKYSLTDENTGDIFQIILLTPKTAETFTL